MIAIIVYQLFAIGLSSTAEYKTVNTGFGAVRGRLLDSYGGYSGFVFAGIPFAKPPVGSLRFRKAQFPDPWKGILDTFEYRNACMADPDKTFKTYEGNSVGPMSEDCLYLNLFVSRTCLQKGGCSVMVAYHGGNMKFESPILFEKPILVNNFANDERNVIVVTVPYRLATFGWFHLTKDFKTSIDSNVGTEDAIFSLKWIQKEIRHFGGDPNRVTIYGHSAGAVLTQHLALLPATEDLFHQVISQSGPADILEFSRSVNIGASRSVTEVAGCAEKEDSYHNRTRVEEIIDCMRSLSEGELNNSTLELNNRIEETAFTWIEDDGIMPTYRKELMRNPRKLPLLIGATTGELRLTRKVLDDNGAVNTTRLHDLCILVAYMTGFHQPEKFLSECLQYYSIPELASCFDDHLQFYKTVGDLADAFSRRGAPVFVYSYDYWGAGDAFVKFAKQSFEYVGPAHSEDFIYVLGTHRNSSGMLPKDFEIERIYSGMIANFVNYGDPTPPGYKWKTWNSERRNYFKIDFDENLRLPGMQNGYYLDVEKFWKDIVREKVGDYTPLEQFPQGQDNCDFTNIDSYILTSWTGKPEHIEKTMNASLAAYNVWSIFVKERQQEFMETGTIRFRNEYTEVQSLPEMETTILGWVTASLLLLIVGLLVFIGVMKVMDYRRKIHYTLIH